jgi:hypothetical protein
MKTTPRSEADALRVSSRALISSGMHNAQIVEAVAKLSKRDNDMLELGIVVTDANGDKRTLRDWLTDSTLGAAKLRHAVEAVGALAKYDAGEIGPNDFQGHYVRVKIGVEKKRGFAPRNVIEDYATSAASSVVTLRSAG